MGIPHSTYYRLRKPEKPKAATKKRVVPRALSENEKQKVIEVLHEERFVDKTPYQIYSRLLDEKNYVGSVSTMYRCLRQLNELKERRNILRHPKYKKPELLATGPNQVWSWDITKLRGPVKWSCYYLYVILDIYSRYVVGWMVARREDSKLAKELIDRTCKRQQIARNKLIIHSDRGPSMTSHTVAELLTDLGVQKSLNRPHVSNDNPYSESQFKTMKYCPAFPERFGCIEDARAFLVDFFEYYNNDHYHSGIGFLTPAMVHSGEAEKQIKIRQKVLSLAFQQHPERFVNGLPKPLRPPKEVWINPPKPPEKREDFIDTVSSIVTPSGVR